MRRGMGVVLALVLMVLVGSCALADDYGNGVIDAPSGWTHMHEEASSASDSMGHFLNGTRVMVRSEAENGWIKIKIGRESGYIKAKYLKTGTAAERVEPEFWTGTVRATNYARMRYGPSTEYQFACNVYDGENVTIMGKTDENWYYVRYKDEEGFISENLVYTRGVFGEEVIENDWQQSGRPDWPQNLRPVRTPVVRPAATRPPVNRPAATKRPVNRPVTTVPPVVGSVRGWQRAYTDYLAGISDENDTYALIYVNQDNVPELVIDSGTEAKGCRILTYANGEVSVLVTRRLGFTYIERGNRLCNSDGSMNSYFDDVYEISNGRWVCIARGEYFGYLSGWNEILGRYVCRYYRWNGQNTDISQYMKNLGEIYNSQRAVGVEEGYSKEGILWLIAQMR